MTVTANRHANFLILLSQFDGNLAAFARASNSNPNHFSQIKLGQRNVGHLIARRLELLHNLSTGWMDEKHDVGDLDPNMAELLKLLDHVPKRDLPKAMAAVRAVLGVWRNDEESS